MPEQTLQNEDALQEVLKGTEPHGLRAHYQQEMTPPPFLQGSQLMGFFQQTSRIIPPPEEFERYPQKVQDSFLECLNEQRNRANKEQEHRHICELKRIENEQKRSDASYNMMRITAVLGFTVLLFTISGSILCAYFGFEKTAITLGSSAVVAICGSIVKLIWGDNKNTPQPPTKEK